MKKWLFILIGMVGVTAIFYYLFLLPDAEKNSQRLETATVKKGALKLAVSATGVVVSEVEVEVKSKAGGEIINFPFKEGDDLKRGDVVVRLDPETEQSRANQANADLLVTEARLEKAKVALKDTELRLKRQRILFEEKVISMQDLDDAIIASEKALSDVKIAEAELIRAREALKEANDRLKDTEIRAPITGTILKKYVEEGQVIASTLSSASEGTLLFTMADLNRIYVSAMVDETDIGRVKLGQEVVITVDAYLGKEFKGRVTRIAPKGRVESTITVFDVAIEVADEERQMLKPMMTANVEILTDLRERVLLVPSKAVRLKGEEMGIYKLSEGRPLWTSVSIGKTDGIFTEIQGDIKEGDEVVISKVEKKKEGHTRNISRGFWFFHRGK